MGGLFLCRSNWLQKERTVSATTCLRPLLGLQVVRARGETLASTVSAATCLRPCWVCGLYGRAIINPYCDPTVPIRFIYPIAHSSSLLLLQTLILISRTLALSQSQNRRQCHKHRYNNTDSTELRQPHNTVA